MKLQNIVLTISVFFSSMVNAIGHDLEQLPKDADAYLKDVADKRRAFIEGTAKWQQIQAARRARKNNTSD